MFIIPLLISVFSDSVTAQYTNSPNAIVGVLGGMSIISLFFYAAIMGVAVYRDEEHKTAQTYFTFPISEKNYILGRFFGSFTIVTVMNIAAVIGGMMGFAVGAFLERPDYGTYTSFNFSAYALPFVYLLTFNAFFIGSLFFCLMTFFKRMSILYLGGIVILILTIASGQLLSGLDTEWLSVYVDPFGETAHSYITKYWTIDEQNTLLIPMDDVIIYNRLIWIGVGILALIVTYFSFSFSHSPITFSRKRKAERVVKNNFGSII